MTHALTVVAEVLIGAMLVGSSGYLILVGLREIRRSWRGHAVRPHTTGSFGDAPLADDDEFERGADANRARWIGYARFPEESDTTVLSKARRP